MANDYLFTSESVSEGHPDKVADQISDAVVDLFLAKDPEARVACETLTTTNRVVLAGEVRGRGMIDTAGNWEPGAQEEIQRAVRETVKRIGYEQSGFHWQNLTFENHLHPQSSDIAQGVDASGNKDEGAGDQARDVRIDDDQDGPMDLDLVGVHETGYLFKQLVQFSYPLCVHRTSPSS